MLVTQAHKYRTILSLQTRFKHSEFQKKEYLHFLDSRIVQYMLPTTYIQRKTYIVKMVCMAKKKNFSQTSLCWHSLLLHSCILSDSSPNKLRDELSVRQTGCSQACLDKARVHHLNAPPTYLQLFPGNAPKCTSSTCCFHSPMLPHEYLNNLLVYIWLHQVSSWPERVFLQQPSQVL